MKDVKVKSNKINTKKVVAVALAVAAASIAGSAGAATGGYSVFPYLTGINQTGGCVRFYVDERYASDIKPNHSIYFGQVLANHTYRASVFKGACGGKAIRTVSKTLSYTPSRNGPDHFYWYVN